MEPTFNNQIAMAEKIADDHGIGALYDPHVLIGKICGCKGCFCCAALLVYNRRKFNIAPQHTRG
jgi:hypothetical protein